MQKVEAITHLRLRLKDHGTFVRFSVASIGFDVTSMLCSIVILRWVRPEQMGVWQSALLVQTYAQLLQAGVLNGLNRELPFTLGAGRSELSMDLAGTARMVALIGSGIVLLGLPFVIGGIDDKQSMQCLVAALIGASAALYRGYLGVTYRARAAFEILRKLTLVEALAAVVTLPLVYWLGLDGLLFRFVLLTVFGVLANHVFRPIPSTGRYSWRSLRLLLGTGLPIFAFGYLGSFADTLPRLILLSKVGTEAVGLFAPALAAIGVMRMVPISLAKYVYPQMTYRLGKTGDPMTLWPMAKQTAFGILMLSIPVLIPVAWFTPAFISRFFPLYSSSANAVQWTVLAGFFLGASIAVNALNSMKAWRWMAIYAFGRTIVSFSAPYIAFRIQPSLDTLAIGVACGEALAFIIGMGAVFAATHRTSSGSAGSTARA